MQESIVFLLRVQCRRKESSHSLSHLLMSFLFKKLLLRNCVVDFVEICNVCARKAIIEAAKRINSDKLCHSYSDLNFGVTFLEHSVYKLSSFFPLVSHLSHIRWFVELS